MTVYNYITDARHTDSWIIIFFIDNNSFLMTILDQPGHIFAPCIIYIIYIGISWPFYIIHIFSMWVFFWHSLCFITYFRG